MKHAATPAVHADDQTLNVSNSTIEGDKNQVIGDNNSVSGVGNAVQGSFNHISGDTDIARGDHNTIHGNNMFIMGTDGISPFGTFDPGNFNKLYGNNSAVFGNGNVIYGDGDGIGGNANVLYDVHGGKISVSGDNNLINAKHSDTIDLLKGTGNELNFSKAKSGFTSVKGFIAGDEVLVGSKQTAAFSSDASGTTLHLHSAGNKEYEVFFSDTTLATVQDSMHVVGRHVPNPQA